MAAISKVDPARLGLAANTVHKFYTGFSWTEIQEILKALNHVRKVCNDPHSEIVDFDYPEYGGLSKRISKRLTSDQVDILNQELPTNVNAVARCLCLGRWA